MSDSGKVSSIDRAWKGSCEPTWMMFYMTYAAIEETLKKVEEQYRKVVPDTGLDTPWVSSTDNYWQVVHYLHSLEGEYRSLMEDKDPLCTTYNNYAWRSIFCREARKLFPCTNDAMRFKRPQL